MRVYLLAVYYYYTMFCLGVENVPSTPQFGTKADGRKTTVNSDKIKSLGFNDLCRVQLSRFFFNAKHICDDESKVCNKM